MADAGSTLKARGFTQEQLAPASSSSSSSMFQDTPNEVPREYLMASPSSLLPLAGQGFPFPPQQPTSDIPAGPSQPLSGFIHLQEHYKKHFQEHHNNQASLVDKVLPSSSSKPPELDHHSSSARLVHEQRLSTCLNILRHIQRTLRQRHEEATLHLARTSRLAVQTTWHLFFQSPLDFMCHEMDILVDSATSAILSQGGDIPRRHSVRDSEAWMRKLDGLRDLRDDEYDAKQRVGKTLRQMQCADAMMRAGLQEQAAALEGDPMVDQYRRAFDHGFRETEVASSKNTASATSSTFFNWPLPATSLNDDEAGINTDGDSSVASGATGQCDQVCCRRHVM